MRKSDEDEVFKPTIERSDDILPVKKPEVDEIRDTGVRTVESSFEEKLDKSQASQDGEKTDMIQRIDGRTTKVDKSAIETVTKMMMGSMALENLFLGFFCLGLCLRLFVSRLLCV